MKWKLGNGKCVELWEMQSNHISNCISMCQGSLEQQYTIRHVERMKKYGPSIWHDWYMTRRKYQLVIGLFQRELKWRQTYPEYAAFCKQCCPAPRNLPQTNKDTNMLSAFADWLEQHAGRYEVNTMGMLTMSRRIRWWVRWQVEKMNRKRKSNVGSP